MISIQLSINGNRVTVAGKEGLSVLSSILSFTNIERGNPISTEANTSISLSVGGLLTNSSFNHEYLDWIKETKLKVGDEISIKILDTQEVDEPIETRVETKQKFESEQHKLFQRAKETYFAFKDQYEKKEG